MTTLNYQALKQALQAGRMRTHPEPIIASWLPSAGGYVGETTHARTGEVLDDPTDFRDMHVTMLRKAAVDAFLYLYRWRGELAPGLKGRFWKWIERLDRQLEKPQPSMEREKAQSSLLGVLGDLFRHAGRDPDVRQKIADGWCLRISADERSMLRMVSRLLPGNEETTMTTMLLQRDWWLLWASKRACFDGAASAEIDPELVGVDEPLYADAAYKVQKKVVFNGRHWEPTVRALDVGGRMLDTAREAADSYNNERMGA